MENRAGELIARWQKRNISGFFCKDKQSAINKMLEIIPVSATIGISGSVTLEQLEIVTHLEARGNKVLSPYKSGLSREENLAIRRQGTQADFYLASANALSEKGELVFFSAYGNRTAGISYAKNVIVVCGMNKLVPDLHQAVERARNIATPLNVKRLGWKTPCAGNGECQSEICLFPEYKRMCCQTLIIEAEVTPERMRVILVDEKLGY